MIKNILKIIVKLLKIQVEVVRYYYPNYSLTIKLLIFGIVVKEGECKLHA